MIWRTTVFMTQHDYETLTWNMHTAWQRKSWLAYSKSLWSLAFQSNGVIETLEEL